MPERERERERCLYTVVCNSWELMKSLCGSQSKRLFLEPAKVSRGRGGERERETIVRSYCES
jgi:hypothetical protein